VILKRDQLVQAWRETKKIEIPYFGGKEVELFFDEEDSLLYFSSTIINFLTLGEDHRLADTRHPYSYFKDFTDDVGFDWVEEGMEMLTEESPGIWGFVYPNVLYAEESWDVGNKDQMRKFVVLEGNCGWEAEHGILMSWRDGNELVKVSEYDGHATHGHAYDDVSKDAFVYFSNRPEMCTRPVSKSNSLLSRI
jgi:hypothetical protein